MKLGRKNGYCRHTVKGCGFSKSYGGRAYPNVIGGRHRRRGGGFFGNLWSKIKKFGQKILPHLATIGSKVAPTLINHVVTQGAPKLREGAYDVSPQLGHLFDKYGNAMLHRGSDFLATQIGRHDPNTAIGNIIGNKLNPHLSNILGKYGSGFHQRHVKKHMRKGGLRLNRRYKNKGGVVQSTQNILQF